MVRGGSHRSSVPFRYNQILNMQPDHRIRRGCHTERDEMREWPFDGVSSVPVVVSRSVIDKHARGTGREDLYFWQAGTIHFPPGGPGGDGFRIHGDQGPARVALHRPRANPNITTRRRGG